MELTHYNYLESILCVNNTREVSIKTKLNWYFLAHTHTLTPVSILQQRMKVMSEKNTWRDPFDMAQVFIFDLWYW